MKQIPNPVLDEHYPLFLERLRYWQQIFGLLDWRIALSKKKAVTKEAMAEIYSVDIEQRSARFRLGKSFGEITEVNHESLDSLAKHEMAHLWLYEFKHACQSAESTEDQILSAEHRVINTLDRWSIKEF